MVNGKIYYSVVIPFHNEELSVAELLGELTNVMESMKKPYEIIAVDDCSTDKTCERLRQLTDLNSNIKAVFLPIRKGQAGALAAGFSCAHGNVTISMDGDLQDDPSNIPPMLKKVEESGADVVCGWRWMRDDSSLVILYSRIGNFFQRLFLGVPVHDISCTFRVYKTVVLEKIRMEVAGLHRFLPFLIKRNGFSLAEHRIKQRPRKYGTSKYSSKKAIETIRIFFGILSGKY